MSGFGSIDPLTGRGSEFAIFGLYQPTHELTVLA
jgi:hypothetical protein